MPNWVYNTLYMEGIGKADLYSKRVFDEKEEVYFDFNKLIPEPKTEEECREKYDGDRFIDKVDENGESSNHLMHTETDKWFNWYEWHWAYWGTKWNAVDTVIEDDDTVRFSTAWGAPEPIFRAISRMFPEKVLDVFIDYEIGECSYECEYLNGECIKEERIVIETPED